MNKLIINRRYPFGGVRNTFMSLGFVIFLIGLTIACTGTDAPFHAAPMTFVFLIVLLSPITLWYYVSD